MITAFLLILAGYLCGALPFGYWVAKAKGIDLTKMGSGSTGATNVYRCVGKKEGILVLVLDLLKGYIPVTAAIMLDHGTMALPLPLGAFNIVLQDIVPCLVGAMCMIGHSKSVFLNFTGGKSAATGLGTITALNPAVGGLVFVVFVSLVYSTRLVSLASISAGIVDVLFMALFKAPPTFIGYAAFGGLLVIIRHKANIQRLLNGTEPRFGQKSTGAPVDSGSNAADKPAAPVTNSGSKDQTSFEPSENSSENPTDQVKADEKKP